MSGSLPRGVAVAAALAVSVALMAAAGLPAGAVEGAGWSTGSDVTDSDTTVLSNESITVGVNNSSTEDLTLRIYDDAKSDDEVRNQLYTNSSPDTVDSGNGTYQFVVSNDSVESLPHALGNTTYYVEVEDPDGNVIKDTITVVPAEDERSDVRVLVGEATAEGDGSADGVEDLRASSLDFANDKFAVFGFGLFDASSVNVLGEDELGDSDISTVQDTVSVNGTDTTVVYSIEDADTQETIDAAVGEDAEAGDRVLMATVSADDTDSLDTEVPLAAVYVDEAGDDVETGSTYAVLDTSDYTLTVHNGDEFDDDVKEIQYTYSFNQRPSFGAAADAFGYGQALDYALADLF